MTGEEEGVGEAGPHPHLDPPSSSGRPACSGRKRGRPRLCGAPGSLPSLERHLGPRRATAPLGAGVGDTLPDLAF